MHYYRMIPWTGLTEEWKYDMGVLCYCCYLKGALCGLGFVLGSFMFVCLFVLGFGGIFGGVFLVVGFYFAVVGFVLFG